MPSTIAERIKYYRKKAGLTQDELAEAANLNRVTVAQYEAGRYEPSAKTLSKLADALGITANDLINDTEETQGASPAVNKNAIVLTNDELRLIANYRSLNRQGKEYIQQQMAIATTIYKNTSVPDVEGKAIS